jgi:hypothetical protein
MQTSGSHLQADELPSVSGGRSYRKDDGRVGEHLTAELRIARAGESSSSNMTELCRRSYSELSPPKATQSSSSRMELPGWNRSGRKHSRLLSLICNFPDLQAAIYA